LLPFEIKLHSHPSSDMTRGLSGCMNDLKISRGYIIYPGEQSYSLGNGIWAVSASQLLLEPQSILHL
jgi:predicted AAA+ superfamily ATPase